MGYFLDASAFGPEALGEISVHSWSILVYDIVVWLCFHGAGWLVSSQNPESFTVKVFEGPVTTSEVSACVDNQVVSWVIRNDIDIRLLSHVEVSGASTQETSTCFRLVINPETFDICLQIISTHHKHISWDGPVTSERIHVLSNFSFGVCVTCDFVGVKSRSRGFLFAGFDFDSCASVFAD